MELTNDLQKVIDTLNKTVVYNMVVYDMKTVTPFYDYMIIASCSSARQGHASINYLRDLAKEGFNVRSYSAMSDALWYLADLGNIVVHVFVGEERARYNLDGLYYNLDKMEIKD
ncbi:MAG: ribosome silencing factor [Bacilli bacterium]|nr:ribosome silencing factor [Bacilli bacterium]